MDFPTNDLAIDADRRPGQDFTARYLDRGPGVRAGADTSDRLCEGGRPWQRRVY
ncbi:MAG: hypothetical protein ACJ736_15610 [Streptomyces sp.]